MGWDEDDFRFFFTIFCFCVAGISRLRARQGGFALAPLTPSQRTPIFLILYRCFGKTEGILTKKLPIKLNKHRCDRRFPKGDRKALWSPPQRRNSCTNTRILPENALNSIARRDSKGSALYSHPAYAPTAPSRLTQNPITISGTLSIDVRPLCGFRARIATYTHGSISSR